MPSAASRAAFAGPCARPGVTPLGVTAGHLLLLVATAHPAPRRQRQQLQYSSVGGAASLDASVYGVSSGTGSGSDGAGIAAVERLRHELGEQKRALSRAFAHIDEMRERGEGVASEARQISSTPSAFAGGDSVTALLASAAAGAPVSVSDVASAAAAAATAATRKEQEALLARVSALEEQVRQQAATMSEAEANSRRAAIATAALNAKQACATAVAMSATSLRARRRKSVEWRPKRCRRDAAVAY